MVLIHARKYSPFLDSIGRPVLASTGPQETISGTFSTMSRDTRSSVSHVMTYHGSIRSWSVEGFPPLALEWCVQLGEASRRSSRPSGTAAMGLTEARSWQ
jgi:hypothetical protein